MGVVVKRCARCGAEILEPVLVDASESARAARRHSTLAARSTAGLVRTIPHRPPFDVANATTTDKRKCQHCYLGRAHSVALHAKTVRYYDDNG